MREVVSFVKTLGKIMVVLKRTVFPDSQVKNLLGAGVFGDSLGTFRDGMFGQFTGQQKPDSGLDFPGGDGRSLVVVSKTGSFGSNALEDVIDKRVHDAHGLGGYTGVGVDLFQDLVDVDSIRFLTLAVLLLVSLGNGLGGLSCLLGGFSRYLWWHVDSLDE